MASISNMNSARAQPAPEHGRSSAVRLRRGAVELFFYLLMAALAFAFLAPMIWMITASLKPERLVMAIPPTFLPRHFQWENYVEAWGSVSGFLFNSIKLAVLSVGGTLFVSSLAAFAFARIQFAGRTFAFSVLLSTLMVPSFVTLIPLYIIYRNIGWIDTHYPLWVPKVLHSVTATFLLRQFFKQIPQELEDAARIDGCSWWRVLWQIVLPISMPAVAALSILAFTAGWNDFLWPLVVINKPDIMTIIVGLASMRSEATPWGLLMAATTISALPLTVVYVVFQRWFTEGITMSGIKG